MKNIAPLLLMIFMITGCVTKTQTEYVCPVDFPKPSRETILTIQETNDTSVHTWMKELWIYKNKSNLYRPTKITNDRSD